MVTLAIWEESELEEAKADAREPIKGYYNGPSEKVCGLDQSLGEDGLRIYFGVRIFRIE